MGLEQGGTMKKILFFAIVLLGISNQLTAQAQTNPPPNPQQCGGWGGDQYVLEPYYRAEHDMLYWNQVYQNAPSGSWEERDADLRRRQAGDQALQAISYGSLGQLSEYSVHQFGLENDQKFNAAPSGSMTEGFYRSARQLVWPAYVNNVRNTLVCFGLDWRSVINKGLELDQLYQAAPSGSMKEGAYRQAEQMTWAQANEVLYRDLSWGRYDFRGLEALGAEFQAGYAAATSGSMKEGFYDRARRTAYDSAYQTLSREIYSYSIQQLYGMEQEYNSRFQSAPSGSVQEAYYRRVRDLARQIINSHR